MTRRTASWAQMVHNSLANHVPVPCVICDRYIVSFEGVPVIMNAKAQLIEFAHSGCCAPEGPAPESLTVSPP